MNAEPGAHSAFILLPSAFAAVRSRRGLGLIELLTVLAVLFIGLGMVVVTARHVRSNSANELTRKRMHALIEVAGTLITHGVDPTLPPPPQGEIPPNIHEGILSDFARRSSAQLAARLIATEGDGAAGAIVQMGVGVGVVGPPELHDAWDRPIALFPKPDPSIGMAPDDGPFFVSAGPDGRFLTLADNIYSYDLPALLPPLPKTPAAGLTGATNIAATQPVAAGPAGQDE